VGFHREENIRVKGKRTLVRRDVERKAGRAENIAIPSTRKEKRPFTKRSASGIWGIKRRERPK